MFTILVVEDDIKLSKLFCTVLDKGGYKTIAATDGSHAMDILEDHYVDLIISDLMMPNMDGFELIDLLRSVDTEIPILVITAKEQFQDKRLAFKTGADDYMVKPINVNEMILRVEALLRRSQMIHKQELSIGYVTLRYQELEVVFDDQNLVLPQKEFQILYKLASHPNRTFTRQQLFDDIWGLDSDSDIRTIDVHINRLRERLSDAKDIRIKTMRGLGYKLEK